MSDAADDECGVEEDDTGYDLLCELPKGHEGLHRASFTW